MSNKFIYLLKKYSLFRLFFSISVFTIISAIVLSFVSLRNIAPKVFSVSPQIFSKTDFIVIKGNDFGNGDDASFLNIGNFSIAAESCEKWTDNEIQVRLSDKTDGGILFVSVNNKKSNPVFIISSSLVPLVKKYNDEEAVPSILSLDRDYAEVGAIIKIYGENFGNLRNNSQIIFVKNYDPVMMPDISSNDISNASYCSEHDFDFEFWSDKELHIRVPDGADSGMIFVVTEEGTSNPVPFRLKNRVGTKNISEVKTFLISASSKVSNIQGAKKNTLFLRAPLPEQENSQRNIKIISIVPPPLVQNYKGASVHQFDNLIYESEIAIKQDYRLDRYAVNTDIRPENIRPNSINNRNLHNAYTAATVLIPSNYKEIKETSAQIIRNEVNPYKKAKKIYDFILKNIDIRQNEASDIGRPVFSCLETKQASPYDAILLFCSLLRAAGVPCEPIAGIAVNSINGSKPHWWAEFYIEGFGWIPVDIGMAKSIPFDNGIENKELWYFGNLDSFRVSYSRGEKQFPPMAVNSKISSKERSFAFRNTWEEAVNITAYTSFWQIPQVEAIH